MRILAGGKDDANFNVASADCLSVIDKGLNRHCRVAEDDYALAGPSESRCDCECPANGIDPFVNSAGLQRDAP